MKKEIETISVQTFEHFRELTKHTEVKEQILFRGQNKDYDLRPGINRQKNRTHLLKSEKQVFENFKNRISLFPSQKNLNTYSDWDYLVLAQHYGLKTRLLDWSGNPYVALWFATSLDINSTYGVVYVYKVGKTQISSFQNLPPDPFSLKKTYVIQANQTNIQRVNQQDSWFTAHYFDEGNYSLPFDQQNENNNLSKLTIPISIFLEMRAQLQNKSDITSEYLYNSIDKMCEDINKTFAPF